MTTRHLGIWLAGLVVVGMLATRATDAVETVRTRTGTPYLIGQLLVATPRMGDPRFSETVIYMVGHDADGAMGLVLNKSYGEGSLASLLEGFDIDPGDVSGEVKLRYGGPVEMARGFVLHSADYQGASTRMVSDGVAFSTGLDVLEAVARGVGPKKTLFILGYAGWGPGQLEGEMSREDWVTAPADASLIFGDDLETMWQRAMDLAGVAL